MIAKNPPRKPRIPKEKVKKPSQKTLLNKADDLARRFCHAVGKCEAHGYTPYRCSERLEWCHLKSRDNKRIRHNPLNFICMCNTCHRYFTEHPDKWYRFIEEIRPGIWDELNKILQTTQKPDYEHWIRFYREQGW